MESKFTSWYMCTLKINCTKFTLLTDTCIQNEVSENVIVKLQCQEGSVSAADRFWVAVSSKKLAL